MWWTYGREVDPPAHRDPGRVAAVRLPRQHRRDHDAFDSFSGNRHENVHSDLWDAVRLELSSTWRVRTSSSTTVSRRPPIRSYRNGCAPRRICASEGLLAAHTPAERREEAIFDIVNQLNRGAALITSPDEREQLAEFKPARGPARQGLRRLRLGAHLSHRRRGAAGGKTRGSASTELTFALELNRANASSDRRLAEAERALTVLSTRAAHTVEKATVACLRAELLHDLDRSDRSVEVALDYLRNVGRRVVGAPDAGRWSGREYELMWQQIGSRPIEAPARPAADGRPGLARDLWTCSPRSCRRLCSPTRNLYCVVIGRMESQPGAWQTATRRAMPMHPRHRAWRAVRRLQGSVPLWSARLQTSRRSMGWIALRPASNLIFGHHVIPWTKPIRPAAAGCGFASDAAQEPRSHLWGLWPRPLVTPLLASGDPLRRVQREAEAGLDFAAKRVGLLGRQDLRAAPADPDAARPDPIFGPFNDTGFDEERFEQHLERIQASRSPLLVLDPQVAGARLAGDPLPR